jgi:Fe-S cluster assembly ATP-binding protein
MTNKLEIKNLHVEVEGKEILKGINLEIKKGEITAIMGPNGSGKSTLSYTIMGHQRYKITKGSILLDGKDLTELKADQRAKAGLFLSFQYPSEISGVKFMNFLRTAINSKREEPIKISEFKELLEKNLKLLKIDKSMISRNLNEGFSGGEKKKAEILQMALLNPTYAILDETDSGLDIDALKIVSKGINALAKNDKGILLITHYQRLLDYVKPDKIYVLMEGKIVLKGTSDLALKLEDKGYDWILKEQ